MITIIYSMDLNKPRSKWTSETYTSYKEAAENALDLLEAGFYVKIESEE